MVSGPVRDEQRAMPVPGLPEGVEPQGGDQKRGEPESDSLIKRRGNEVGEVAHTPRDLQLLSNCPNLLRLEAPRDR